VMINHDHLLTHIEGVDGLKTGFTNGAGFCLATTAQRNGRRVIVVVMGSPDSKVRDLKVAEFVERGFASLPVGGPPFAGPAAVAPAAAAPAAASPITPAPAAADSDATIKFAIPKAKK